MKRNSNGSQSFERGGLLLPAASLAASPPQIAALLGNFAVELAAARENLAFPAAVSVNGELAAIVALDRFITDDPFETPVSIALRWLAHRMRVPQLCGTGATLHLLVTAGSHLPSEGDIYNSAPELVCVTEFNRFTPLRPKPPSPAQPAFWSEAEARRGIKRMSVNPGVIPGEMHKQPFRNRPIALPHPNPTAAIKERTGKLRAALSSNSDQAIIDVLHEAAAANAEAGGGPFAAMLVSAGGEPLGAGVNMVAQLCDPTAHGERVAIWDALNRHDAAQLLGATLFTSSYPCIGCAAAAAGYGIKKIVFGNSRAAVEAHSCFTEGPLDPQFLSRSGVTVQECRTPGDGAIKPFKIFQDAVSRNPQLLYLNDMLRK